MPQRSSAALESRATTRLISSDQCKWLQFECRSTAVHYINSRKKSAGLQRCRWSM